MWSVQARQEIQSGLEWQCSILHILFTQKLWTDPRDLQFSSPSFHLTPFISAPLYAPLPSSIFATSIFITSPYFAASVPLSWLKNALVSCHSILLMGYGTLQGVASTQDLIPNLLSTTPTPSHSNWGWEGGWALHHKSKMFFHVSMMYGDWISWIRFSHPDWDTSSTPGRIIRARSVFFFSNTHSSVTFQLMSHMVGAH